MLLEAQDPLLENVFEVLAAKYTKPNYTLLRRTFPMRIVTAAVTIDNPKHQFIVRRINQYLLASSNQELVRQL